MTVPDITPGIKLGTHISSAAPDEDLLYLKQLGIDVVRVHFAADQDDPAYVEETCRRFSEFGLAIFSVVYLLYQAREIAFGLPGRTKILDRICRFIRTMGRNGLHTLEYDFFLYAPLPETGTSHTRGCTTRLFSLDAARQLPPITDPPVGPDDMWNHYTVMMEALLPAAEKAGVRLALHPDDPPVPSLLGSARIFHDLEGIKRAMAMFDSPNWGLLMCIGTWAEGGDAMGMTVDDAIRFFAERGKLFTVHFRNVSAPLPQFAETFLDNGYIDMRQVMQTLSAVGFDGLAIPDHFPSFHGDTGNRASLAYAIGYMRGLMR